MYSSPSCLCGATVKPAIGFEVVANRRTITGTSSPRSLIDAASASTWSASRFRTLPGIAIRSSAIRCRPAPLTGSGHVTLPVVRGPAGCRGRSPTSTRACARDTGRGWPRTRRLSLSCRSTSASGASRSSWFYAAWMRPSHREELPRFIEPMLATSAPAPAGERWAIEIKWDGMRAQLRVDGRSLSLRSRSGRYCASEFPELAVAAEQLGDCQVILDAELVCFGSDGKPDFAALRARIGRLGRPHGECCASWRGQAGGVRRAPASTGRRSGGCPTRADASCSPSSWSTGRR